MSDILNGPPADSATSTPPPSNPAQGQPADGGDWLTSLPEDLRGVAEHKGWKDPADALRSYKSLEEYMGADKAGRGVVLPKDGEDVEGYERIYKALGRPDDADGYELNSLFGEDAVDENVLGAMSQAMHEAGLSKAQAQKMGAAYQEMYKSAMEENEARLLSEISEAESSIPAETQELAKRGFRLFRLPKEEGAAISDAFVRALGPKAAVELFSRLGSAAGEDRPIDGATGVTGGDPQRRIDQLLADPGFNKRYLDGDQAAKQQIDDLYSRLSR